MAAAEIDFYGGIRSNFEKLVLDFGVIYYYYPDGRCFNFAPFCPPNPASADRARTAAERERD